MFAVAVLASAGDSQPDEIQKRLELLQSGPDGPPAKHPAYVVLDKWPNGKPKTIFAALEENETNELVALRVDRAGELHRLAAYGNDVRSVELADVTGDGRPEVL